MRAQLYAYFVIVQTFIEHYISFFLFWFTSTYMYIHAVFIAVVHALLTNNASMHMHEINILLSIEMQNIVLYIFK